MRNHDDDLAVVTTRGMLTAGGGPAPLAGSTDASRLVRRQANPASTLTLPAGGW
jgi:hypothetical protein